MPAVSFWTLPGWARVVLGISRADLLPPRRPPLGHGRQPAPGADSPGAISAHFRRKRGPAARRGRDQSGVRDADCVHQFVDPRREDDPRGGGLRLYQGCERSDVPSHTRAHVREGPRHPSARPRLLRGRGRSARVCRGTCARDPDDSRAQIRVGLVRVRPVSCGRGGGGPGACRLLTRDGKPRVSRGKPEPPPGGGHEGAAGAGVRHRSDLRAGVPQPQVPRDRLRSHDPLIGTTRSVRHT
mmetsp:Transcript_42976/g.102240  ORF Transcript_42976/g.102240 Transcript_42976/m.102240 type:complete len:241 (+) Transcript_42976:550-1272(+)